MLEATCGKCGETFIPSDVQDIIHTTKEDGTFCGGTGQIEGEYGSPSPYEEEYDSDKDYFSAMSRHQPEPSFEDREAQAAYDDHWRL